MLAQRVIAVIAAAQKIPAETISLDNSLMELGIDSLQGLNLLFELETEFDVNIPNSTGMNITHVRDLVEGLEQLMTENTAKVAE